MALQNTDLLLVQRGSELNKTTFENLKDSVIDGLPDSNVEVHVERKRFTVTSATQNEFDLGTNEIIAGNELTYLNGLLLNSDTDYTIAADKITLTNPALEDDVLEVICTHVTAGGTQFNNIREKFTVNNPDVITYNLTDSITVGNEQVFLNGSLLNSDTDYTATTSQITLASKAFVDDVLEVFCIGTSSVTLSSNPTNNYDVY